jgi:hypothetical protein
MLKRGKVEQLLFIYQEAVFMYLQLTIAYLFMLGCLKLLSEL